MRSALTLLEVLAVVVLLGLVATMVINRPNLTRERQMAATLANLQSDEDALRAWARRRGGITLVRRDEGWTGVDGFGKPLPSDLLTWSGQRWCDASGRPWPTMIYDPWGMSVDFWLGNESTETRRVFVDGRTGITSEQRL